MRQSVFNKVDISMEKNHATIRTYAKNGKVSTKVTDVGSVLRIFKDQSEFDTGDLPVIGDNAIGIRRLYQRGNRGFIIVNGVNLIRDIHYGQHNDSSRRGGAQVFKNMYLPGMMLALRYQQNGKKLKIIGSNIFAHKDLITSEKDTLYIPPYGNVYGNNNCKVCWGSAGFNSIDNIGQSIGVMEAFVGSHFNSDLYQSSWASSREFESGDLSSLLSDVERWTRTNKRFPYEHIKMRRYGSYGEMISYLQNNL